MLNNYFVQLSEFQNSPKPMEMILIYPRLPPQNLKLIGAQKKKLQAKLGVPI